MANANPPQPPAGPAPGLPAFHRNPNSGAYYPRDPENSIQEIKTRPRQELPPAINQVLQSFIPHALSAVEIQELQDETRRRLDSILNLFARRERAVAKNEINTSKALGIKLVYERIDLAVRYFRIFPIHDLPLELLGNIFRYVVWAVNSPQEGVNTRLAITHTCTYWRRVAIADTTLWSAVWFRDHAPHTRSWSFLDRAQITPIDIRIDDTAENPLTDAQAEVFMDRLVPKLPHTRMLLILLHDWEPILTVMKKLNQAGTSGMPIGLERFELHRVGKPSVWPGQSFQPVGHARTSYPLCGGVRLPKLTFFAVNGITWEWDASVLVNLTTLDLRRIPIQLSPTVETFRKILLNCPRLEKLSLDGAGPNARSSYRNTQGKIVLNQLHTLVLANFTLTYAQQILSFFSATNINDLTLMNFMGEYTPLWETLRGRFPLVQILTLYGITCTVTPLGLKTFIGFLHSMPKVQYVRIASVGLDVLQAFMYDTETYQISHKFNRSLIQFFQMIPLHEAHLPAAKEKISPVLPLLRYIEVESLDADALHRFVGARIIEGAPITTTYIAGPMPNFTLESLRTLIKYVSVAKMSPGARTPEETRLSDLRNRQR